MVTNLNRPNYKSKYTKGPGSNLLSKDPKQLNMRVDIECKLLFE